MNRKEFILSAISTSGGFLMVSLAYAKAPFIGGKSRGLSIRQIRNATLVIEYGGKKVFD